MVIGVRRHIGLGAAEYTGVVSTVSRRRKGVTMYLAEMPRCMWILVGLVPDAKLVPGRFLHGTEVPEVMLDEARLQVWIQ